MLKACRGSILVNTLAVLEIMTLLALMAAQTSVLDLKISRHALQEERVFQGAEFALRQGERALTAENLPCRVDAGFANHFFYQGPRALSGLCPVNYPDLYAGFKVEKLPNDPCQIIEVFTAVNTPLLKQPVVLYRITAIAEDQSSRVSRVLQSTFVVPGTSQDTCQQPWQPLSLGRQSWRETTDVDS